MLRMLISLIGAAICLTATAVGVVAVLLWRLSTESEPVVDRPNPQTAARSLSIRSPRSPKVTAPTPSHDAIDCNSGTNAAATRPWS
jgi:hypothetical protein